MLSHIDICRMNRLMEHNPEAKNIIEQLLQNHQTIVSLISHEIRNPLTLISSSLQLMEQTHPEVRDFSNWDQTMQDLNFLCQLLSELSAYNNGSTLRYQVFFPSGTAALCGSVLCNFFRERFCQLSFQYRSCYQRLCRRSDQASRSASESVEKRPGISG